MERGFPRSNSSLEGIFAFADEFLSNEEVDAMHRFAVKFALEEIFTNMVKYNPGVDSEIQVILERAGNTLTMRLVDVAKEPFDITAAPPVRVDLPLDQRQPGGLGIHLTKKLVDEVHYEHKDGKSHITMIKSLG